MLYISEIHYQSDGELFFPDYTDQRIFNCAPQTFSTSFFFLKWQMIVGGFVSFIHFCGYGLHNECPNENIIHQKFQHFHLLSVGELIALFEKFLFLYTVHCSAIWTNVVSRPRKLFHRVTDFNTDQTRCCHEKIKRIKYRSG